LHPVIPGSAAQAESGSRRMTAEERRKASGPLIGPRLRLRIEARQPLVRRSALRLPLLGSEDILESKDIASRPFEASFVEV